MSEPSSIKAPERRMKLAKETEKGQPRESGTL